MPSSPNKKVYNNTSGRVEIAFNIEVTSYTPVKQMGSDWLFHYDAVFDSFNIPFSSHAGTFGIEHTILGDHEDIEVVPRSSIPSSVNGDQDTGARSTSDAVTPSLKSDSAEKSSAETTEEVFSPLEVEVTATDIGTTLGDNLSVDTVVTTRVNKNHPIDNIIGDPHTGVRTRKMLKRALACMQRSAILVYCIHVYILASSLK